MKRKGTRARARERVRLAPGWRLRLGTAGKSSVLTSRAGPVQLNESAAAVLALCDGTRTREEIVAETPAARDPRLAEDVRAFLAAARRRGWIVDG
jgi:pyrroloquinoline quinone biosynthesis protein D